MTFFFGDGFDCYRDITDCGTYWDAAFGGSVTLALSASGRFTGSRGVTNTTSNNTIYITRTSGVNDAVHHISVAFQQTFALSGTLTGIFCTLYDGTTAQCSIAFRNDGAMLLMSGSLGATLATYTGAISAVNTWYQFEIEVVINNTTGSISVRRNGNTTNDFTATGLNTRASANNYANKIGIGNGSSSSQGHFIDDFLWRSDASSVAWIGDVRCYTRMPAADSAVQFTRSGSVVPVTPYVQAAVTNSSSTTPRYAPFIATCSGTVGSTVLSLALVQAGNAKCSLFSDSGTGIPGAILGSATPISAMVTGNNTFTFGTPVAVTQGVKYWIGFAFDTGVANALNVTSAQGSYSASGYSSVLAYASFPAANPAVSPSVGIACQIFAVNITPTTTSNANLVSEVAQDAAAGYVLSSTNGQADLYTLAATPSTPAVVIGVTTRGLFQKSDAGTRNATVQLKSGGTTVAGASTALPVGSWQWIARNDLTDPATSAAWTAAAVNAALVGPSVTA
jgi:hypothetical protein